MSIPAIIHKHRTAPGLRMFGSAKAATLAGENPADLVSVAGILIKWPSALGAPPDEATIAQWEQERIAAVDLETKRRAAIKAIEDKARQDALDAALNDPNAPQAVKDYKQAKK